MRFGWLPLVCLTGACKTQAPVAAAHATSKPAPRQVAPAPLWTPADPGLVEPIRAAVARLRELPWQRSVPVHVGASEDFDALLSARGVVPNRSMVGVYLEDTVWLRRAAGLAETTETVAHELVHALEEQHGLLQPHAAVLDEAGLARSTLHEGVAIAVARGVVAEQAGSRAPRRAIAELGAGLEELQLATLIATDDIGSFEQRFPYAVGGGFAGALYTTGGARLWTAAERTPPTSLVQVLRPALYLTGYRDGADVVVDKSAASGMAPQAGWIVHAMLSEADPIRAGIWMNDFRGAERTQSGALAIAFGSDATARSVARELPQTRRLGSTHVVHGRAATTTWKPLLPALGAPPLPEWPRAATVLYPLEHDPSLLFQPARRGAQSEALGLGWPDVHGVTRKGLARSELWFESKDALVSAIVIRLAADRPIENGLSLLVQAFVASEVAALQVHDEPPLDTPAGPIHLRRIDTPSESVSVALLPRCQNRYALAFVAFARELPAEVLRARLAHLRQNIPDAETSLCRRAIAEEASDFTPSP